MVIVVEVEVVVVVVVSLSSSSELTQHRCLGFFLQLIILHTAWEQGGRLIRVSKENSN